MSLSAANALKDRRLDSSYGATFYPWVQTRDAGTGQLVWVPPTVAMMGVLASSEAISDIWFAPAGFNRGGLTEGAAGIPISNVSERLSSRDYRLILDETTTTPDLIDQNILYAKIMVKPARAIEFIAIDFVIASTGASFDD